MNLVRVVLAIIVLFASFSSFASTDKPAMIIRFNNEVVAYERSLEKIVQSALKVKPSTFFDIVAVIPEGDQSTRQHTSAIERQIKYYGVTEDRLRITFQNSNEAEFGQVHVFVR